MKFTYFLILTVLVISVPFSGQAAEPVLDDDHLTSAGTYILPKQGELRIIDHAGIEKLVETHGADLLVINFWATWCAPCVAELPYFQEAHKEFKEHKVIVVGFNMDKDIYGDAWEETALSTMKRKGVTFPQFEPDIDMQETVPYFSSDWQGELPATFYFTKDGKKVGERLGAVKKETLFGDIEEALDITAGK